jgi:N-acetylglucosaminyldiphosphoundecaprenol N-acetyl-beta-D-mannosaminyltransferase
MSIVFASRFIKNIQLKRFTGYDVLIHFLNHNEEYGINKVMFIGSSEKVQQKIAERLKKEYPLIKSVLIMLPYKKAFEENDTIKLKNEINKFRPELIFVGLSAPKQEIFTFQHLKGLKEVKIICNIGAAFDFFAKTEPRAPQWMQNVGMEGVFRTFFHPVKHFKKDIKSYPFLIKKLIEKIFLKLDTSLIEKTNI